MNGGSAQRSVIAGRSDDRVNSTRSGLSLPLLWPTSPMIGRLALAGLAAFVGLSDLSWDRLGNPAFAQSTSSSALDERTAELRAFRARLRSDDDVERAAAFELGMSSTDAVVQKLTMKEAFAGHHKDIQTVALRHWISAHTNMIVQLTMPDRPSEATSKAGQADLGEDLLLERLSINAKDEIDAFHAQSGMRYVGRFVPGGIIMIGSGGHLSHCDLNLSVIDDTLMSGAVRCKGLDPLAARVQIQ